jgi:hypothetical protein
MEVTAFPFDGDVDRAITGEYVPLKTAARPQ